MPQEGEYDLKVLVIADKQRVARDVAFCLGVRYPEIKIIPARTGRRGIKLIEAESPDLVMLDSSLPDMDTMDIIHQIRGFSEVLIIILCDVETDMDRAMALEAGADEYVDKPISPVELLSKVRALLRRTRGAGFGRESLVALSNGVTINLGTREVFLSGKRVRLTPHEYDLLSELASHVGRVCSHRLLLERVWGKEYAEDLSYLKKYIYRLRSKLEPEPRNPRMLLNERGVGYRLVPIFLVCFGSIARLLIDFAV